MIKSTRSYAQNDRLDEQYFKSVLWADEDEHPSEPAPKPLRPLPKD